MCSSVVESLASVQEALGQAQPRKLQAGQRGRQQEPEGEGGEVPLAGRPSHSLFTKQLLYVGPCAKGGHPL